MEFKRVLERGVNQCGKAWCVSAELPAPDGKRCADFYLSLEKRLISRAGRDGSRVTGRTVVTYESDTVYSLYIELTVTDPEGVMPASVIRLCDTRAGELLLPIPKRLKRRECHGFCIIGDRAVAFLPRKGDGRTVIRQRDTDKCFDQIYADIDLSLFSSFAKKNV